MNLKSNVSSEIRNNFIASRKCQMQPTELMYQNSMENMVLEVKSSLLFVRCVVVCLFAANEMVELFIMSKAVGYHRTIAREYSKANTNYG